MSSVTVFCSRTSPRLVYILDWIFGEVFQCSYLLTDNEPLVDDGALVISYGKYFEHAMNIPDGGLLWENGVMSHSIESGIWNGIPTIYANQQVHSIPFDVFSAIFFLLSRYEEYYNYSPDNHNRYPATESVALRQGWIDRPVVDEWLLALYKVLREKGAPVSLKPFSYQATYDIDIAFSFKHKGIRRTGGAIAKAAMRLNAREIAQRVAVLSGYWQDPYDCFDWLEGLHCRTEIRPIYFVLASLNTTAYDKNISPRQPKMARLIAGFKREGEVGLHPSYYSNAKDTFGREKRTLEEITDGSIGFSRQHYIRLSIPETYYSLLSHKITDDWSMGYGSRLGFRAGTGRSFLWYDLKNEAVTSLRIHPFCFMDTTARFEEGLSPEEAFKKLNQMHDRLKEAHSTLVTVFHNFSLGRDEGWSGWAARYEQFLAGTSKTKALP